MHQIYTAAIYIHHSSTIDTSIRVNLKVSKPIIAAIPPTVFFFRLRGLHILPEPNANWSSTNLHRREVMDFTNPSFLGQLKEGQQPIKQESEACDPVLASETKI
ncbi:Uncharacterized protein Rs2_06375 [Raphanus sativus]|nr:Uncharacterized protein Rs2_06375 [Raphanus sativus]